jgi:phage FluMu protein Com
MKDIRCGSCNKLLGKVNIKTAIERGIFEVKVEIKCRCGNYHTFEEKQDRPNSLRASRRPLK